MSGGGSGGGGGGTTIQKTEPWDEAKPYYTDLYKSASEAYKTVDKSPYTAQLVANRDPNTLLAQRTISSLLPTISGATGGTMQLAQDTTSGKYLDAASNPYLQSAIDAANRSTIDTFKNEIVPTISSSAISSGAYGGARQGIALGTASDTLTKNLEDTAAKIAYQNYATERGYQNASPTLTSSAIEQSLLTPTLQSQLGAQNEAYQQSLLDSELSRWNANKLAGYTGLGELSNILGAGGYNSSYGTMSTNGGGSTLSSVLSGALGGGALGWGLGSASGLGLASALGVSTGGLSLIGAGLGGLMGGLF